MTKKERLASEAARYAASLWMVGIIPVEDLNQTLKSLQTVFHVEPFCVRWPFQTGIDYIFMPGIDHNEINKQPFGIHSPN